MTMGTCKECGVVKPKIQVGKNNKGFIYADTEGNRWTNGRCHNCYSRIKNGEYKKYDPPKGKVRHCRKCKKKLKPDRYFTCNGCQLNEDYIQETFGINGFHDACDGGYEHISWTGE